MVGLIKKGLTKLRDIIKFIIYVILFLGFFAGSIYLSNLRFIF